VPGWDHRTSQQATRCSPSTGAPCASTCVRPSDKIEIKCYFETDETETSTGKHVVRPDSGQWFAGTLDWATIGRLWDNKGGNRLRSKYLVKVARSVSLYVYVFVYTYFFLSFTRKTDARAADSLSQIVINGTEVEAYRIEVFTERNECWMRGYYEVRRISSGRI